MPDPRDHRRRRNVVETIGRYIPGFRGYLEKEYRRESDRLVRMWIVDRLRQCKRVADGVARDLLAHQRIQLLPHLDRIRGRLDAIMGRVDGAVAGYSGFFDYVRVNISILDRIYEHDVTLMQTVEHIAQRIESWQAETLGQSEFDSLLDELEKLNRQWDARTHILEGID